MIEGPNACDHMAFCALNSFLKEVNEAAWLLKCRACVKANLKNRIAGSSCRPAVTVFLLSSQDDTQTSFAIF